MEAKTFPKRMSNDLSNGPKRPKKGKKDTIYTCAVIVAMENKIQCHLNQILDIKVFNYQGVSVLLSGLFY